MDTRGFAELKRQSRCTSIPPKLVGTTEAARPRAWISERLDRSHGLSQVVESSQSICLDGSSISSGFNSGSAAIQQARSEKRLGAG
jgi:hypothetical protein